MFWDQFNFETEAAGFILKSGQMVEVKGTATADSIAVASEDILAYIDQAAATWHTHTNGTANLSMEDYESFVSNPNLKHFIVAVDEVRGYEVVNGQVLNLGSLSRDTCTPSTFTELFGVNLMLPKATPSTRKPRGKRLKASAAN